jgi:hypothetical protein
MVMSLAVLFMFPAILITTTGFLNSDNITSLFPFLKTYDIPLISIDSVNNLSIAVSSITALFILLIPNANILITNLATEFVCANDYLEHGIQRQIILGNLDKLVDYISEENQDCKIDFHTYSFGSIIAIDYLYPFGNNISKNANSFCQSLITIGTPVDFIKSYYPNFFTNRKTELLDSIIWLNIYSVSDALGTTFRKDDGIGDAEFSIPHSSNIPLNINYEIAQAKKGIGSVFTLYGMRAHGNYWDKNTDGQSCMRGVYEAMKSKNLIA